MSDFLLLGLCPLLGMLAAWRGWMPADAPLVINAWLMRVALPCVILVQIPKLQFDSHLLLPALGPIVLMFSTMALMSVLAKWLKWDRGTQGAMTLCWGMGNTSFVGFPLLTAIIGTQALGPAVIADQATFFVLTLVGLPVAAYFAGRQAKPRELLMRIVVFAPFLALFPAFAAKAFGGWPAVVEPVFQHLASTLTPLALFSVGLQFRPGAARRHAGLIAIGTAWKMITLPALMWAGAEAMGAHGLPITVGILQVAMAPMITAGILAEEHGLAPEAANAIISVGIALSFITVPVWNHLIA